MYIYIYIYIYIHTHMYMCNVKLLRFIISQNSREQAQQ